jgi:peptide/nickel transport system substrate-binding protein
MERGELVARALAVAIAVSLLAVSGAGGASAQSPKRGGTLVFRMVGGEPTCLNQLDVRCTRPPTAANIVDKVLARPFVVDTGFAFRPRLVSGVQFTRKRPFTLTYRIRPKARWSDGVPITARDFVFTLRAIRKHGTALDRSLHAAVRSARAVDAKTLRVVLRPRIAGWRSLFGNVLPSHALRGEDLGQVWTDRIENPKTGRPIGSGPFLVERWDRGRELVLRRNPEYWGPHTAYLDRIVVKFVAAASDPTEALERGELDVATGVPLDDVPAIRRKPRLRVSAAQGATFEHLDFRLGPGGHPALRNKLVRRALAYGLDRPAIVRQVYTEIDPRLRRPLDNMLLLTQEHNYAANWNRYRFRPGEARRLLEQAGCRRGTDGIYSCTGERLSFRLMTNAGIPSRERALSVVQDQLRRVGIEVRPVFVPGQVFFSQILPSGAFEIALYTWVSSPGASWKDVYGCAGPQNFTGYCQRLVTTDLDQADRILDTGKRARALNRIDRRMARDVPTIPLYQFVVTSAYDARVHGFSMSPNTALWNAENWWLER